MKSTRRLFQRLFRQTEGATASEYAVMLMLILVAAVGAILNAGSVQKAIWFDSADKLDEVAVKTPSL
jgi:Flp pilus assembly pilin Flp